MTYNAFKHDVLTLSPQAAATIAHQSGVSGRTIALWLNRLSYKS